MQKAETVTRRPGYYWVRLGFHWAVAVWHQREGDPHPYWFLYGTLIPMMDDDLHEIGERVLPNGSASLRRKDLERMRRSDRLSWVCIASCVLAVIIAIIEILTR